jgi:capsular polysaccharide biosynthesis protein
MLDTRFPLRVIERGWWIILLAVLGALNIALLTYYWSSPVYRASSRLVVTPTEELTDNREMVDSLDTLDNRSIVSTYAEVLTSRTILEEAAAALQIEDSVLDDYDVSAVVLPETNVVQLSTTGPDPQYAMAITNAIGEKAITYIAGLSQIYELTILDPATASSRPISPKPMEDISLTVGVGLIIGLVLAFLYAQPQPIVTVVQRS